MNIILVIKEWENISLDLNDTKRTGRDNGIDSIIRNAPLDEKMVSEVTEDGKFHYYILKAGNRQEIARSCYYESKEEMEKDYAWVRGANSTIGGGYRNRWSWYSAAAIWPKSNTPVYSRPIDEYLPCEEYKRCWRFYQVY